MLIDQLAPEHSLHTDPRSKTHIAYADNHRKDALQYNILALTLALAYLFTAVVVTYNFAVLEAGRPDTHYQAPENVPLLMVDQYVIG